jgi:hypothetical protein
MYSHRGAVEPHGHSANTPDEFLIKIKSKSQLDLYSYFFLSLHHFSTPSSMYPSAIAISSSTTGDKNH